MLDYDSARSKLRKLIDKPGEDPTKLPRVRLVPDKCSALTSLHQAQQEHDETKEMFDILNDQLITELPQLLELRVPYFDPSFEAMIRMQYKFAEEGYEKLSGVQRYVFRKTLDRTTKSCAFTRYFADNVRDDYAAGQLDAQVCLCIFLVFSAVFTCI